MYRKWEIVKASVKFEENETVKDRPILVLFDNKDEVIAYKITSKNKGEAVPSYPIVYWQKAGLDRESYVIILKPIKVYKSKIISKYGDLQLSDIFGLEKAVNMQ